jgi:hypothetical protein
VLVEVVVLLVVLDVLVEVVELVDVLVEVVELDVLDVLLVVEDVLEEVDVLVEVEVVVVVVEEVVEVVDVLLVVELVVLEVLVEVVVVMFCVVVVNVALEMTYVTWSPKSVVSNSARLMTPPSSVKKKTPLFARAPMSGRLRRFWTGYTFPLLSAARNTGSSPPLASQPVHSIAVVTLVSLNSRHAIMPTRSPVWSEESEV